MINILTRDDEISLLYKNEDNYAASYGITFFCSKDYINSREVESQCYKIEKKIRIAARTQSARGFVSIAAVISSEARYTTDRVAPQVGQGIPVIVLKKQDGAKESTGIIRTITSVVSLTLLYIWRFSPRCAQRGHSIRKPLGSDCDYPNTL